MDIRFKNMYNPNMTIAIYHKDCIDGTGAAAVVLKKFPDAKVFPLSHGFEPHELEPILSALDEKSEILIVDGVFAVRELLERGYRVTAIDHHIGINDEITEVEKSNPNFKYIFDNNRSGAALVWSTLFPNSPVPELISLIEDQDIWKWKYGDDTKHVNNYLHLLVNKPDEFVPLFDSDLHEIKKAGKVITLYSDYKIEHAIKTTEPLYLTIGGHEVPFYNINENKSLAGNQLATIRRKAVALFSIDGMKVKISFRSLDNQRPNALELAKLLGGGGHENASGAGMQLQEFFSLIKTKEP